MSGHRGPPAGIPGHPPTLTTHLPGDGMSGHRGPPAGIPGHPPTLAHAPAPETGCQVTEVPRDPGRLLDATYWMCLDFAGTRSTPEVLRLPS